MGTGGTFTALTSTVNYNRAGAQTSIGPYAYANLTLSGSSSGAKTFPAGTTTVSGILSMEGQATATVTGTLTPGAASTLQYKGSVAQTTGGEFKTPWPGSGGVKIENANGTGVTLGAARSIGANPLTIGGTIANSVFNDGGFQLTSTGILNLTSGTFKLGIAGTATTWPTFGTNNISSGTTVEYAAGVSQTVSGTPTYQNLKISGAATKTAGANLTVNGTLTVSASGDTLNLSTFTLGGTLGTITNAGTIRTQNTSGTPIPTGKIWGGTVNYDATTGGQTVMAGTYSTLTMGNSSGTQTASGALAVTTLNNNTNSADILNMSTFALTATTVNNTGTIRTQNTSGTPLPTGLTWGGTVNYDAATGGQTVMAGTYSTLTMGNTSGTQTASGVLAVTTLNNNTNSADVLNLVTYALTATTVNNTGTIRTQNTSGTPLPTGFAWGGTITYDAASGSQTVVSATSYNNLTLGNTSGTSATAANLVVNGTLTTTASGTLNLSTFTLGGTLGTITNGGTIRTQNTSGTPIPTGKIWGGTVNYDAATGGQTIMAGTYSTLTMGNTSGTQTASGALATTTLNNNTNSADILNLVTYALTATTVNNTGTIRTQNTTATPLPTGLTWGGTVNYDAATGAQTVRAGTYSTLTMGNTSGTQTADGALAVTTLNNNTNSADIFNMSTFALTATTVNNTGTIRTQNTSGTPLPTGLTWGGTVNYDAATGGQTVMAGTYSTLTMGNTSGTQTASGALATTTLNNNTNSADILNLVTYALTATTVNNTGTIRTQNTSGTPLPTGFAWGGTITYDAASGSQTVVSATSYNNLTLGNTSGTSTTAANLVVNGTLTTTAGGTLDLSTFTLGGILGTITNNGTIKTSNTSGSPITSGKNWGGTFEYASSGGAQTMVAGTYNNLIQSGSSGSTLGGVVNVGGTLTLTSGIITTGANNVYIGSTGSVSGGSTASHVFGNLRKWIGLGVTSKTFEIGDGTNYAPVNITGATVGTADDLTVKTTTGQHPNLGTSSISGTKNVNRYWSFTAGGSLAMTYDSTFNFVTGDIIGGADFNNFIVGKYSGSWSYPAVGTKTSTSTKATGLSSFSDFALGEGGNAGPILNNGTTDNVLPALSQVTDGSGKITITFRVKDAETDSVSAVNGSFYYQVNGGGWSAILDADITGTKTGLSSATDYTGALHTLTWDNSKEYIDDAASTNVQVKFKVNDGTSDSNEGISPLGFSIDNLDPGAFTVGSVITTGGTVVASKWNATNTGVDVTTPIANDASLTGGTLQIQAEADGSFENIGSAYTILVGDLGTSKTLSISAAALEGISGFSEGDNITFKAIITDLAGNSTLSSASVTSLDVDQTPPAGFTVGSVITTGGTVVASKWNSTNTGVDVTTPIANDATLTGGTLQIQAEADGSFENIGSAYTILIGDLGTSKTLSISAAALEGITGFSEGDNITFKAIITDLAGNSTLSSASVTSLDVDQIALSVTINQAAGQADPTTSSPINFTAVFSEPTANFITGDVTLGGTASPTTGTVTEIVPNDGTTYNVAVTGMSSSGTVIASIGVAKATDAAGNSNTASTSGDNQVSYAVPYNISGTTDLGDGGTIAVALNGVVQTGYTGTVSLGTWTIVGVPIVASDIVTVWNDGAGTADETTAVTKQAGVDGNITGMVLNRHVLSLGSSTNESLTLSDLGLYDNDQDNNIMHSANASVLNVDANGVYTDEKINILIGDTLTIGGTETLNTVHLTITGTLTSGGNSTYIVSGDWTNNGTFTISTSSVTLNGTGAQAINGSSAISFNNLVINKSGTATLGKNTSIVGDLTISSGTLDLAAFTINRSAPGGILTIANGGTLKIGDSNTLPSNYSTHSFGATSTVEYGGTATTVATPNSSQAYGNLVISGSAVTTTNSFTVATSLSVSGSLVASNLSGITMANGSSISNTGTLSIHDLTIAAGSVTGNNDFTVEGVLTLNTNASATVGNLVMGANTLTMGASATTVGAGDVTGIVKRTSFIAGTTYTFGNQYTTFNFQSGGTLPTDVSYKITIGSAPAWKLDGVQRTYDIIHTGGSGHATINAHYLDSELNSNTPENHLVVWTAFTPFTPGTALEFGRTNYDVTNNWVGIAGGDISILPTSFDQAISTFGLSAISTSVWDGSTSTAWWEPTNWNPDGVPSDLADVEIPDASTTPNAPILNPVLAVGRLTLNSGAILNTAVGYASTVTISGGSGAWSDNGGTFNAGTGATGSTIIFTNAGATISGVTEFYNVMIDPGAAVTMGSGGTMRIGGTMTNNGTWRAAQLSGTTVEYNGAGQTVLNPNGLTPGYDNLILSGTGGKTMPATTLSILGDFTMSGSASATAAGVINTTGNLTVGAGNTFTMGAYSDTIGGNLANHGTFTATGATIDIGGNFTSDNTFTATGSTMSIAGDFTNDNTFTATGSAITFDGTLAQAIGGTNAITFNNLTINNSAGVTLNSAGQTVAGALTLTSGNMTTGANNIYINSTGSVSGGSTGSHIIGNLRKQIPTGSPSKTFEIGDASNYTPVAIDFNAVSTAGDLTLSTADADCTNINTSTIKPSRTANRCWTTTNSGIVLATYDSTFNFVAGDLDGTADPSNFIVGKYNAGWTYPTVGTQNPLNTQITGETTFSDFQLGNVNAAPILNDGASPDVLPALSQAIDGSGKVTITFRVKDADLDSVSAVNGSFYYQVNGGGWNAIADADVTGTKTGLSSAADYTGALHTLTWDNSKEYIDNAVSVDVQVKFKVNDGALDSSEGVSPLGFDVDNLAAAFTMQYYSDSGLTTPIADNSKLKAGTYYVKISSNEALSATPTVSIDAEGTNNDVTNGATISVAGNDYKYTRIIVSDGSAVGITLEDWSATGTDSFGNTATNANPTNEGLKTMYTDTVAPTNQDTVFTPSATKQGGASVTIVSSGDATNEVWFAPSGTTIFIAGATMTKAASGTAVTILAPANGGSYKLFVIDAAGNISAESAATLTVDNLAPTFTMQYYSDSGLTTLIADNSKLKAGTYYVKISANEALSATPTVSIAAEGTNNDVTNGATTSVSGNDYKYTRTIISDGSAVGTTLEDWSVTGTDIATNTATDDNPTNEGLKAMYTDTTAPTFTIQYYSDVGLTTSMGNNPILVVGTYYIKISADEALSAAPTISIAAEGTNNDATNAATTFVSGNDYKYTRTIVYDAAAIGAVLEDLSITGQDVATNLATNANPTNEATKAAYTDTTAPYVTNVTSSTGDGHYNAGDVISIQVVFSESVTVAVGTPQLTLETGASDAVVNYSSGSPSATLTFDYNIGAGENSTDLDYNSINALALNGATIKDTATGLKNASLFLFTPGDPGSLGDNKNIAVDTTDPVISAVAPAINAYINNITTSSAVNYTIDEDLLSGAITMTGTSGPDIGNVHTCTLAGTALNSGAHTALDMSDTVNGCTSAQSLVDSSVYTFDFDATDLAGNNAGTITNTGITFDATKPDVTIDQAVAQSDPTNVSPVLFTAVFSEPINTGTFTGSDVAITGTATTGLVTITEVAPNDKTTFEVSVVVTDDGTVIADIGVGNVSDVAGNTNNVSTSTDNTVNTNYLPPTIGSITSVAGDTSAPYYDATDDSSTIIVFTSSADTANCNWDIIDTDYGSMSYSCASATTCTLDLSGETAKTVYLRCKDNADNEATSSFTLNYTIDATKPDVTIDQKAGQLDPSSASPVLFTAIFSEPINTGTFTNVDVAITGTATTGLVTITEVAPNDGTTFDISVVVTADGTVIADILAGNVADLAGNTNNASTSTDNTIAVAIAAPPPPSGGMVDVFPTNYSVNINSASCYLSNNVSLNLACENATQVMISNNPDFSGASWQVFDFTTKNWTLESGDGIKTVYVKYISSTGRVSQLVSASIEVKSGGCEIVLPEVIPPVPPEKQPVIPGNIIQAINPLIMLFDQINYQGNSVTITQDNPDLRNTSFGQDVAASIRVFGGAIATLFQHINYGGRAEVFTADDPDLSNNLIQSQETSSVKFSAGEVQTIRPGDLLKNFDETIYYYGWDGKRHTFPTRSTFNTWYADFSLVKFLPTEQLQKLPLGANVTFKPGVKMIKLATDPKVYAVDANGTLRWIVNEEVAVALYGPKWTDLVADISDAFFVDYKIGADINSAADFNPTQATALATSIDVDKDLIKVEIAMLPKITYTPEIAFTDRPSATIQSGACKAGIVFTSSLKLGNDSNETKELQKLLQCLNYFPSDITPNGKFSSATEAAVKKFQAAKGLAQTGSVGPLTREELNKY
ncbi:MAG: peptidoglycan-binding protein [Candidatus Parcubacteria bacterium]|nr:peptidoglycan-binding protein [Candidatus Parcubacteria bacterium]